MKILNLVLIFVIISIISCEKLNLKRNNPNDINSPLYSPYYEISIITDTAYIESNTGKIYISGELINLGYEMEIYEYGVCWAKNNEPNILDNKLSFGSTIGSIEFNDIIDYPFEKDYYYFRAYYSLNDNTYYSNIIEVYYADYWIQKVDFDGSSRGDAVGFVIGNKGYIGTGLTNAGTTRLKSFWEYNSLTDSWTRKADFGGEPREGSVGFSIGNKGYIGTGWVYPEGRVKDFWEYDQNSNTWTQIKDFPGSPRYHAVGFSIGDKGYAGLGDDGSYKTDFWEYDPTTDSWSQKSNFPGSARIDAVGFSINNKGYIAAGYGGSYKTDFWEYDPLEDKWTEKQAISSDYTSYGVAGFTIDNKGFICIKSAVNSGNDFWEYNPEYNTWIQKQSIKYYSSYEMIGFSLYENGYIIFTGSRNVFEYEPE